MVLSIDEHSVHQQSSSSPDGILYRMRVLPPARYVDLLWRGDLKRRYESLDPRKYTVTPAIFTKAVNRAYGEFDFGKCDQTSIPMRDICDSDFD